MYSALDFLQTVGKVDEGWISGTIFVVSKDKAPIIMHTLTNKTATLH